MENLHPEDQVALRKKTYDLVDMLAQVTAENIHAETATGPVQGNEEW